MRRVLYPEAEELIRRKKERKQNPLFRYIMQTYQEYHQQHGNDDPLPPLPKRFALHLNPSLKWKFISIDTQVARIYSGIRKSTNREAVQNNYNLGIFTLFLTLDVWV
jgi:hypothetical protein